MISAICFAVSLQVAHTAPIKKTFRATARTRDGVVAYIEKHELFFDENNRIQSASTTYERESGEVMRPEMISALNWAALSSPSN